MAKADRGKPHSELKKKLESLMRKKANPEEIAELFSTLSIFYADEEDSKSLISIAEKFAKYTSNYYGESSVEQLYIYCLLALTYSSAGDRDSFDRIVNKITSIASGLDIPDNLAEIISGLENGYIDFEQGVASELYMMELNIIRSEDGIRSLRYLNCVDNLVASLSDEGEPELAVEIIEKTIDEVAEQYGKDLYLGRLYNIASYCYQFVNDFESAAEYKKKYISIMLPEIGIDNPIFKEEIINYLDLINEADKPEIAYGKAKEYLSNIDSTGDFASNLRFSMAISKRLMGRIKEGVSILEENLRINRTSHGDSSAETLSAMRYLSRFYIDSGDFRKAINLLLSSEETTKILYDDSSDIYIEVLELLVEAYLKAGIKTKAIAYIKRLKKNTLKTEEKLSPASFYVSRLEAKYYLLAGEYNKALNLLLDIYDKQVDYYGDSQEKEAIETLLDIAYTYDKLNDVDRAETLYKEVLESALIYIGPSSELVERARNYLDQDQ